MVEIIIKQKGRRKAKCFKRHLEEEHPEVRGMVKIKNTFKDKKPKGKMSFKRQAAMVTRQKIDL